MSCKIITIFSNKGGVGKTFVAVNTAAALALKGKKVLVVDFDLQAGQNMARMFNLTPAHSLVDILSAMESDEKSYIVKKFAAPHSSGLDFLPAVNHVRQGGHITPDNIRPFFKRAAALYDYIIIDADRSFSETLISVLDNTNLILLVTTPDILAVYQAKSGLEILQSLHFPLKMSKLILNRAESRGGVAWQEVQSVVACDMFALVPSDGKTVGLALNRGIPCVIDSPRTRVSEVFFELADKLQAEDIYVHSSDVVKVRTVEGLSSKGNEFWEKFGIAPGGSSPMEVTYKKEEDEVIKLKKVIHQKLVERMNLKKISPQVFTDTQQAANMRKAAEKLVTELLAETSGTIIASHEERSRLVREIVNEALGLGPLEDLLVDEDISDIMVNNKDEIFIEKNGKIILTNKRFISNEQVRATIDRIIAPLGRRVDESTPMVDARLPDGSRINAIIPPLALNGPMITIRKFSQERYTMEDLLTKFKSISQPMADFLDACVIGRKNMIISGGTGAGKTTLLNIVSHFIPDNERIITIEDAAELRLSKVHWARLESRPSNVEGKGHIAIRDLFINTLRMRPDRIIIGECRGPEVLDMMQAMNTGHDGSLTTLHANTTRDVLARLSSMVLLSGIELPIRAIYEMVASSINIIVQISRFSDGSRKITAISELTGKMVEGLPEMKDVFVFKHRGINTEGVVLGEYVATGFVPKCYDDFMTRGIPLSKTIFNP
ncbi:MAG: Flp pilus assembly complex ATPase component TadA [Candidatus Omnitrophica bacterium]|nr:Flp pilus assembly complex ATPase component TadA [Candidatus Omnitrophota bacterium]